MLVCDICHLKMLLLFFCCCFHFCCYHFFCQFHLTVSMDTAAGWLSHWHRRRPIKVMLFIYMYNMYLLQYICSLYYRVWRQCQKCSSPFEILRILPDTLWGLKIKIWSFRCAKSHPAVHSSALSLLKQLLIVNMKNLNRKRANSVLKQDVRS